MTPAPRKPVLVGERRDKMASLTGSFPVRRTLCPASINAAANHPEVRPWLGEVAMGPLDFAPLVSDPANVTMANDSGAFLGHKIGAGVYEIHSAFMPEGRGRLRAETARGLLFLFTATDCQRVVTKVPACNPRAAILSKQTGFVEVFARPDVWDAPDGSRCAVSYQALTLEAWALAEPSMLDEGRALLALVGLEGVDETAARFLGVVAAMARAGNLEKAAWFYTAQAAFAGLPPVGFLSAHPPLFTLNNVAVQVTAGALEALS